MKLGEMSVGEIAAYVAEHLRQSGIKINLSPHFLNPTAQSSLHERLGAPIIYGLSTRATYGLAAVSCLHICDV